VTASHAPGMTTTSSDLDRLTLRSPDALIAALPYLLGFHPVESAVVVWLRAGRLLLTQRLDLPADDDLMPAWQSAVWSHAGARSADELVLVIVSDHDADSVLVAALVAEADARGVHVRDAVQVTGDRWRSLMCTDGECCPPEGRRIDPHVRAEVGAEFAVLGRAPMADRDAVVASMAEDPVSAAAVARVRPRARSGRALERWRDDVLAELLTGLAAGPGLSVTPSQAARLLDGIADVRVRDTLLWECGAWAPEELTRAADALVVLLRCAPSGRCAPVATCIALMCWLSGDGARALVALDRAASDDPGYSLAALLSASLRAGLPPTAWREAVAGLTREACRYGDDRGLRPGRASL